MSTIEKAVKKTETQDHIESLAIAWHEDYYTEEQAKRSAELQSLNFADVIYERSKLYEKEQCANEGFYHGIN